MCKQTQRKTTTMGFLKLLEEQVNGLLIKMLKMTTTMNAIYQICQLNIPNIRKNIEERLSQYIDFHGPKVFSCNAEEIMFGI